MGIGILAAEWKCITFMGNVWKCFISFLFLFIVGKGPSRRTHHLGSFQSLLRRCRRPTLRKFSQNIKVHHKTLEKYIFGRNWLDEILNGTAVRKSLFSFAEEILEKPTNQDSTQFEIFQVSLAMEDDELFVELVRKSWKL